MCALGMEEIMKRGIALLLGAVMMVCTVLSGSRVATVKASGQPIQKPDGSYSRGQYFDGTYEYDIINNGTEVRISQYWGKEANLVVPQKIAGLPVTRIEQTAFASNYKLQSVVLPDGLQIIGNGAFQRCKNLKKIHIPKSVKKVYGVAFSLCYSLSEISGGEGVKSVGNYVFKNCKSLKKIPLPNVKSWGAESFEGTSIKSISYSKVIHFTWGSFRKCKNLKKVIWKRERKRTDEFTPSSVEDEMFEDCTSLEKVVLPQNATRMYKGVFKNCTRLKSVTLPKKLKEIYANAFRNCKSLKKLVIPKSVNYISKSAFRGCKKLKLYVYPKSYALKYAKRNHMEYKVIKK